MGKKILTEKKVIIFIYFDKVSTAELSGLKTATNLQFMFADDKQYIKKLFFLCHFKILLSLIFTATFSPKKNCL